jgi:hypothetical protein
MSKLNAFSIIHSHLPSVNLIMTQDEILTEIRADLPSLKNTFGLERIGLFGSYAKKKHTIEVS